MCSETYAEYELLYGIAGLLYCYLLLQTKYPGRVDFELEITTIVYKLLNAGLKESGAQHMLFRVLPRRECLIADLARGDRGEEVNFRLVLGQSAPVGEECGAVEASRRRKGHDEKVVNSMMVRFKLRKVKGRGSEVK